MICVVQEIDRYWVWKMNQRCSLGATTEDCERRKGPLGDVGYKGINRKGSSIDPRRRDAKIKRGEVVMCHR